MSKFQVQFHNGHTISEPCADCNKIDVVEASDPLSAAIEAFSRIDDPSADNEFLAFVHNKSHWTAVSDNSWFLNTQEFQDEIWPLTVTSTP